MNGEDSIPQFKLLFPLKADQHTGPEARSGHRIVVDESNIYCYGGYNPTQQGTTGRSLEEFPMFRELWRFNLASRTWHRLLTTGNAPNESASYACVLLGNKLFVFGGTGFPFAEVRSNKLYCCDLTKLSWSVCDCTGNFPDEVYGHSMIFLNGYIYLFGGTTGFFYNNDMFRLDMNTLDWALLHRPPTTEEYPNPRYRHEMATDGKYLFLFGGGTSMSAEPLEMVWAFNIESGRWMQITCKADSRHGFPAPRKCHGCVQQGDYVYLSGGLGEGNAIAYKDIWNFDMRSHQWTRLSLSLEHEVYFHATAIFDGSMYSFGGVMAMRQNLNDVDTRTDSLYTADLGVKSLADLCWEQIVHKYPAFLSRPHKEIRKHGVPRHYLLRLDDVVSPEPALAS